MDLRRFFLFIAFIACFCAILLPSMAASHGQGRWMALAERAAQAEDEPPFTEGEQPEGEAEKLAAHWLNAYITPTAQNDGGDPPPRRQGPDELHMGQTPSPRRLEGQAAHRWTDADGNPILGSTYMQSLAHVFPLAHLPT